MIGNRPTGPSKGGLVQSVRRPGFLQSIHQRAIGFLSRQIGEMQRMPWRQSLTIHLIHLKTKRSVEVGTAIRESLRALGLGTKKIRPVHRRDQIIVPNKLSSNKKLRFWKFGSIILIADQEGIVHCSYSTVNPTKT